MGRTRTVQATQDAGTGDAPLKAGFAGPGGAETGEIGQLKKRVKELEEQLKVSEAEREKQVSLVSSLWTQALKGAESAIGQVSRAGECLTAARAGAGADGGSLRSSKRARGRRRRPRRQRGATKASMERELEGAAGIRAVSACNDGSLSGRRQYRGSSRSAMIATLMADRARLCAVLLSDGWSPCQLALAKSAEASRKEAGVNVPAHLRLAHELSLQSMLARPRADFSRFRHTHSVSSVRACIPLIEHLDPSILLRMDSAGLARLCHCRHCQLAPPPDSPSPLTSLRLPSITQPAMLLVALGAWTTFRWTCCLLLLGLLGDAVQAMSRERRIELREQVRAVRLWCLRTGGDS